MSYILIGVLIILMKVAAIAFVDGIPVDRPEPREYKRPVNKGVRI